MHMHNLTTLHKWASHFLLVPIFKDTVKICSHRANNIYHITDTV